MKKIENEFTITENQVNSNHKYKGTILGKVLGALCLGNLVMYILAYEYYTKAKEDHYQAKKDDDFGAAKLFLLLGMISTSVLMAICSLLYCLHAQKDIDEIENFSEFNKNELNMDGPEEPHIQSSESLTGDLAF